MDESERYKLGEFDSCEEAIVACKKIVDEFLEKGYKKGMSFKELYVGYTGFGKTLSLFLAIKHVFSQLGTTRRNVAQSSAMKKAHSKRKYSF